MRLFTFLLVLLFSSSMYVHADDSLDALLDKLTQTHQQELEELKKREQTFIAEKNQRDRLYRNASTQLAQIKTEVATLEKQHKSNQEILKLLNQKFTEESGEFGEVFGSLKQSSSEVLGTINDSIINVQLPGHVAHLEEISEKKRFSSIKDIQALWEILLLDMLAQGKNALFEATFTGADGTRQQGTVLRVGPFTAYTENHFLRYIPETAQLVVAPKQPDSSYLREMNRYLQADNEISNVIVDPLRGGLLDSLLQTPNLTERIQQGGIIAYIIITIGILAALFAIWRAITLSITQRAVHKQIETLPNLKTDNPLGRVLGLARGQEQTTTTELEHVEAILEEGILAELPKLEFGLSMLKITAALAPLLGLLGTVTGMIRTFQDITLYGTGDPRLMAGGISQALVTTVLGLIVAVIIIMLHSWAASRSKHITQILDEQSAGILAQTVKSKNT